MCFFEEKVHSLSVAPDPLAIWNKELEGLESELFKELKTSPVAAPEHISGFFYSKRTRIQGVGTFSGSLLLSDVESVVVRCSCMVVVESKCCLATSCTVLVCSSEYARC